MLVDNRYKYLLKHAETAVPGEIGAALDQRFTM